MLGQQSNLIAALALCLIHRLIGMSEQSFRLGKIQRIEGGAEAGGDFVLFIAAIAVIADGGDDAVED